MKFLKYLSIAAITIAFFIGNSVSAKTKIVPKVYAFGFAASFNDSIVCFTDMQTIDSAYIDSKNHFLLSRDNYSYQLKGYIENNLSLKNRTCIIVFALKQKDLEKKYTKMKRKYTAKKNFDVRYIKSSQFHFERIDLNIQEVDSVAEVNEKKAKEIKKMKNNKEEHMKGRPEGNGPGGPGGQGGGPEGGMGGNMNGSGMGMKE
jgi:hypothetical protein